MENQPGGARELEERLPGNSNAILMLMAELATSRMLWGVAIIIVLGVLLVWWASMLAPVSQPERETIVSFLLRWVGVGFIVAALTSGVLRILVVGSHERFEGAVNNFLKREVRGDLGQIHKEISVQADHLSTASNSLQRVSESLGDILNSTASLTAMYRAGINRIYATREDASEDLVQALHDPGIQEIRIASISLHDYIFGNAESVGEPWRIVQNFIEQPSQISQEANVLHIKILLIHPDSLGALLRAKGESRRQRALEEKLDKDVRNIIGYLQKLKESLLRSGSTKVIFEFRLYTVAPLLSLFATDKVSFVHPFYFWAERGRSAHMPVMACYDKDRPEGASLHDGMRDHFDWIWENASISSDEFLEKHIIGVERAMYQAKTLNVFVDLGKRDKRILWLVRNTKQQLNIQGLSLATWFNRGPLYEALQEAIIERQTPMKVLVLDPDSDQAQYWSYREHLFKDPMLTFEQYRREERHKTSQLYHESEDAIATLRALSKSAPSQDIVQAKKYSCSPSCFLLITDHSVLVRPYLYGINVPKKHIPGTIPNLGRNMPHIEHQRTPFKLVEEDRLKDPVSLLEDHFDFVFDHCASPLDRYHSSGG
jgi:hypothetical protein